jgi:hypothetical protein
MKEFDEPMCVDHSQDNFCQEADLDVPEEISKLVINQPFAVLATQGDGQPYASIISFACSSDLKNIVFSTPLNTRKYSLLSQSDKVALFVDDRSTVPPGVNKVSGVTITGKSKIINNSPEFSKWADLLVNKHSYLDSFVKSPSNALILVDVYRYFLVRRFQEVFEWNPCQK